MDSSIFRYIMRHTLKDQLLILALTIISLPVLYAALEVPKLIINGAIGGNDVPDILFGYSMDQLSYLLILCLLFLLLVMLSGGLKYVLNVYSGTVGERMLRRLRFELFARILRFPLAHFKTLSQSEVVPIITAETEPLGGFIGQAFALPAFQGGMLFTYLFFIFNQDLLLGVVATALYPFQLYVIPKLQRSVNTLGKKRVLAARKLSNRIGDSISGIQEVHSHDTSRYERAVVSEHLGNIFTIRIEIFKKKFFIKFINNFLAQVTPFFFYLFGGYYIIKGELSLGALVAVLAAYKDLSSPWKELLKFYQTKEDVRIKYEQIINQFNPANMLDSQLQEAPVKVLDDNNEGWVGSNIAYAEQPGVNLLEQLNFTLTLPVHAAIVGIGASGKEELGQLLSRLITPTQGRLSLAGVAVTQLSEATMGQNIAYVTNNAHHFSGSIRDNLLYSLQHRQLPTTQKHLNKAQQEAALAGNSTDATDGLWIDEQALGLSEDKTLNAHIRHILSVCDLNSDVFQLGLLGKLGKESSPELVTTILHARHIIHKKLGEEQYLGLVELFDWQCYNNSLTILENIFFSPTKDVNVDSDLLASNKQLLDFLRQQEILDDLLAIGRDVAVTMVDLFSDVDESSDLFERFSFISAEDLPEYKELIAHTENKKISNNDVLECQRFLSLCFKLCPARHRLGLIDGDLRERILKVRFALSDVLKEMNIDLEFFDIHHFNVDMSLQENMVFGKLVHGQAMSEEKITALIRQVIIELDLDESIIGVGLDYDVGGGGMRLSAAQRQKLAIARALIKMPDVIIMDEATVALDLSAEKCLIANIKTNMIERSIIFISSRAEQARHFEQVLVLQKGRLIEQGSFDELSQRGQVLPSLL
jgi:ABC-type multidrug transport system fused ATPase/permease subunit